MAKYNYKLLALDIDKLFQERSVNEIIETEKMIDAEIEKKRVELRSMVGDRYKDILTASDAIKSMKDISKQIVESIDKIYSKCETLINEGNSTIGDSKVLNEQKIEERIVIVEIRLAIVLNEQIWVALDSEDYSKAAQLYLLAQHVHTGLRLLKKDLLEQIPLLKRIKNTVEMLRDKILSKVNEKLQTVNLTIEESSSNLNALMLLENQSSSELLKTFIKLRKIALSTVIQESHSSVRHQLSAMVSCLTITVHLLHDCFISYENSNSGLIWQQLENIVNENAPPTLSKINLPKSPLIVYIPEIIKQFRPKCSYTISKEWKHDLESGVNDWHDFTTETIQKGLTNVLELVTTIKGLHIIREEALKIDIPANWESMCVQTNLPKSFNVWYNFFQTLITTRALNLISKKISSSITSLQENFSKVLESAAKVEKTENDLRWYTWCEDDEDISKMENKHTGLSMKTKGYSTNIINLCETIDAKYLEILTDISLYLYGNEYENSLFTLNFTLNSSNNDRKFADREMIENHLRLECSTNSKRFSHFLQDYVKSETDKDKFILKSLMCARFLQALTNLCPNFNKCCCCSNRPDEWDKICDDFTKTSLQFWQNWVENVMEQTKEISSQLLNNTSIVHMLSVLLKWDTIEIQEQTDEKVFKSQIKIPSQSSLALQQILMHLSDHLSYVLPHTLPRRVHLQFIESNVMIILVQYEKLLDFDLNQRQALQFLFDVKCLTTFCIPRENMKLVQKSQEICDRLRSKVDPFDLDVFYSYLQNNVKQSVLQSQVILGCMLPSSGQLASLGILEKNKGHEKDPSILALSVPSTTSWFPLLPVTAPVQKASAPSILQQKDIKNSPKAKVSLRKPTEAANTVRSGAAALFGAMATDWFS